MSEALTSICVAESLDEFKKFDRKLFKLLNGNLEQYSTKGKKPRLVISRLAKACGVSSNTMSKRIAALREHLGDL